jgi:putative ABC transport system ATP-binding protein
MAVLRVEGLKKSYASPDGTRSTIVDVPEFAVEPGAQVALRGSSGSGKTTFLNLVAGILQPDAGRVWLGEQDIAGLSESARDRARAAHIGYVFQTFNLLQGYTALENVELGMFFGRGVDPAYARALLDRVGLSDRMRHRPRQLSVGQQQRVAVARALANRPRIVLADEPTGNLDHHHAHEALRLIREICAENGAALLLVSHDREILGQFEHCADFHAINHACGVAGGTA